MFEEKKAFIPLGDRSSILKELVNDPEFQRQVREKMIVAAHNMSRSMLGLRPLSYQEYAQRFSFRDWEVKKTLKRLKRKPNRKHNRNR